MCRSTDFPSFRSADMDRLKIRGFYIRFSDPNPSRTPFPESLTLLYLPRISEHALEIDGSKIRPDLPAFVTLYRVVSDDGVGGGAGSCASYGSRDRVCASEGLSFEVYMGEEKALKGVFRRDEYGEWAVDCRCALEAGCTGGEAEVCVSADGHVPLVEKVEMVAAKRRRGRLPGLHGLEEIPELTEVAEDGEPEVCCRCSCSEGDSGDLLEFSSCGGDVEGCTEEIEEVNTDGVRWAVDVGIWVMCVGVGILVSKASARRLRRRRLI